MDRKSSLALLVLFACSLAKEMTDLEALTSGPTRCTYEHAYEMYGAHCAGLRLDHIPSLKGGIEVCIDAVCVPLGEGDDRFRLQLDYIPSLKGGIEILDFSDNKLQELKSDTLSSYTSIRYLYLSENQLIQINDDALSSLTDLQTLDLSKNVILDLPSSILQLPNLRKLYLSGNPLIHMNLDKFAENKVIRAPLELLDISNCKIKELPEWGILPNLAFYNISFNPLQSLEPKHFSVMCNLAKVDASESIKGIHPCDLKPSVTWFQEKHVYLHLGDYAKLNSKEFKICPETYEYEAINVTYQACKRQRLQTPSRKTSRRTWLTISGGLAGFLVGFMLLLYAMHRHNVAKTKNVYTKTVNIKGTGDKQAAEVLLNHST